MKNLYRRYRPLKLEDVVGQNQVTDVLSTALKAGKIGHAYLFIGPRGCGKTSVARILAHEVNGFKYQLEDDYVDIIEIDGASNRGIDDIRELREKAAIAPTSGKYKIYIIDEVHMLTTPAFNALLKTLEEPPAHVIFIMATTDAHKVPVTITSRSQVYTFKLAETEVLFEHLKSIAKQEKIKIADEALKIIAKQAKGSFRDAMSLLDQISTLSKTEITKEMVIEAMGLPEGEKINDLLATYLEGDVAKITTILKDLLSSGVKPTTITEEIIELIIDEPRPELMPLLAKLPEVKEPFAEAKLLVALTTQLERTPMSHSGSRRSLPSPRGSRANSRAAALRNTPSRDTEVSPRLTSADFNYQTFLERVQNLNEVVYKQLQKCEYEVKGNTLHLYPKTKIIKNILTSKNNKNILTDQAGGLKIEVHEAGQHPESAQKDETLSKISDIMDGEVINDGGDNPF